MSNEEKSQEICEKNKRFKVECSSLECYLSAMEMAQWKDDKFYLILACIKVSLEKAGLSGDNFIDEIKKQWEE